jgi:integrase
VLTGISPDQTFQEAAHLWLESRTFQGASRTRYVAPRTLKDFRQYVRALERFFAGMKLRDIHIGNLREYQRMRAAGELSGETVGPNKINQEMTILIRVLQRAGCWNELAELYQPLVREESNIPRAMTPAEQEGFIDVAASRQAWHLVYWYSMLALHTTCHSQEMRGLKIGDLNMHEGLLLIRRSSAKNKYRIRTIPLSEQARWAASQILDRARALGSVDPHHHIFPFRVVRNTFDPLRGMSDSGIKKPWEEVRAAAGLPWLRVHDLRHTAITRLAEAGTPIATIMSMAGHISRQMSEHYTSVSEQAKRRAIEAAFGRKAPTQIRPKYSQAASS